MKFLGVPWGLRPRRTDRELALTFPSVLPSAHFYRVGVRFVCFRGSMATPPILYLRFTASLAVAAQDSRPSGSLLLSCKALSSSASCRFIPAHKNRHYAQNPSTTGSPPSTPNALGDNRLLVCLVPDPACKNFKRFGDPCAGVLSASIACLRQLDGYCRGMSKTDQQ